MSWRRRNGCDWRCRTLRGASATRLGEAPGLERFRALSVFNSVVPARRYCRTRHCVSIASGMMHRNFLGVLGSWPLQPHIENIENRGTHARRSGRGGNSRESAEGPRGLLLGPTVRRQYYKVPHATVGPGCLGAWMLWGSPTVRAIGREANNQSMNQHWPRLGKSRTPYSEFPTVSCSKSLFGPHGVAIILHQHGNCHYYYWIQPGFVHSSIPIVLNARQTHSGHQ